MELPTKYSKLDWRKGEKAQVRNRYIKLQKGSCYWCKQLLNKEPPKVITDKKINWKLFPPNFLKHPIHLQHNHDTDMTEGAVHAYCNAVLWQYEGR
tara:strand:+ start:327 stop:614 length:288 start_codon:yes stop_codon:yes gene_type:complete